jgi:formylmethanofuran dehydrogenase subunit B
MMPSTCLGCGCTCDDIEVRLDGGRIVEARNACPLGVTWFGDGAVPAAIAAAGQPTGLDTALDVASRLLREAKRPLIYLAADLSCEAQREGVALADAQRAVLGSLTSSTVMGSILAAQEQGRASATLGEIRNRSDVLVFWGVDPAVRYPRFWTRYAPEPSGVHVPDGRRSRTVIAVDVGAARGPADADRRLEIDPRREVAVLTLMAAAAGKAASASGRSPGENQPQRADHEGVLQAMQAGRYVTIVADAEPDDAGVDRDGGRSAALIALSQGLNATTRCALSLLRAGGNRTGADACTTSQTGYPAAVDFSAGYPRYRPHEIGGREAAAADVAVVFGCAAPVPAPLIDALRPARRIVIGPRASIGPLSDADVVVDTAVAGIHEAGTAVRLDDVPLPLRPVLSGPPPAASVIRQLRDRASLRVDSPGG